MRTTVVGVLIVIGGVLLLVLLVGLLHQQLNEKPKRSEIKVDGDEQPNVS